MLELLYGIVCLFAGISGLFWVIRDGGRAADWLVKFACFVQLVVVAMLFIDWGHSWVEMTAVSIVLSRFVWLGLPHALAIISVAGVLIYGAAFRGIAALLAIAQTILLIVVMLLAEQKIDLSFLAPVPLVSLYASAIAAFAFFGSSLVVLPDRKSFWYRFVFLPRENLVVEIGSLGRLGLDVQPPPTVFECGSASGWMQGSMVHVSSEPSLWPLRYSLRVRVSISMTWHGRHLPRFATDEKWIPGSGWIEYRGLSKQSFDIEQDKLQAFIKDVAGID